MNISQWVLDHYGQEFYQPGLERMQEALKDLLPELQKSKIVIIAGTNGKGETTHRLRSYFDHESYCSWTSPHIESICERFSSQTGDISHKELQRLVLKAHALVVTNHYRLSFYEFLFLVFCLWAHEKKPKYLFLEVGLGGKFDAVNVLRAELVLLTSISRDHQEFLGKRYDGILAEKLGVLKSGAHLISFLELEYLNQQVSRRIEALKATWLNLQLDFSHLKPFSHRNQLLAFASMLYLKGEEMNSPFTPQDDFLPFRGEIVEGRNIYQFFGSHNLDGVRKLILFLESNHYTLKKEKIDFILLSFSKREIQDVVAMLRALKSQTKLPIVVTSFNHPKSFPENGLKELAEAEGLKFVSSSEKFIKSISEKRILVTGSYYFISSVLPTCRGQ